MTFHYDDDGSRGYSIPATMAVVALYTYKYTERMQTSVHMHVENDPEAKDNIKRVYKQKFP